LLLLAAGLIRFLIWYFGLRGSAQGVDQIGYDKLTASGPIVRIVLFLLVVGGAVYLVYGQYDKFRNSYAVSFDTASASPVELEALRQKFQPDTQATITIREPAKKFLVSGRFDGACVQDLFESICRRYDGKISCTSSMLNRTLIVDLK
jgi:hypothetical protein